MIWLYIPLLIVTHLAFLLAGACLTCWALFGPVGEDDE